jgi:hypothetical protein
MIANDVNEWIETTKGYGAKIAIGKKRNSKMSSLMV